MFQELFLKIRTHFNSNPSLLHKPRPRTLEQYRKSFKPPVIPEN